MLSAAPDMNGLDRVFGAAANLSASTSSSEPSYVVIQVGRMHLTATVLAASAAEVELRAGLPELPAGTAVRMLVGDDELELAVVDSRMGWLRTRPATEAPAGLLERTAALVAAADPRPSSVKILSKISPSTARF